MEINWEEVLAVERDGLEEEDENYWTPQILDFDPTTEESREKLVSLFKLTKAVLAAKVAEADAAREDFQKISTRWNETSEREKDLQDKIEKLRRQVEDTTPEGRDQFWRQEVVSFEMQLEEAEEKLRDAQSQLSLYKKRIEKLQRRADMAEAECVDYKREVAVLKDELSECHQALDKERGPSGSGKPTDPAGRQLTWMQGDGTTTGDEFGGSMRLTSLLREKNEVIEQLHAEIEELKEENGLLEERTVELRNNLKDATAGLEEMTDELLRLKDALDESQAILTSVEEEKQNLASMVERTSKAERENERKTEMDEIFTSQIEELKTSIMEKDGLIAELRSQLEAAVPLEGPDRQTFSSLVETLKEKDLQLMEMRKKLAIAVEEMEATSKLLELSLDDRPGQGKSAELIMELSQRLETADAKIKRLERALQDAEDHARTKDRQLAEVVARTREYLMGEYGLSDAIAEIEARKRDLEVRDKHIESLIQELNVLDMNMSEAAEENENLRRKLGMKPSEKFSRYQDHKIVITKLEKRIQDLKSSNASLQAKFDATARELSETKLALRNASAGTGTSAKQPSASSGRRTSLIKDVLDPRTRKEFEGALEELRGENVFLRQGLNEVLEALREHDGLSDVRLECPSLEKVLNQLEIRSHLGHPCPPLGLRVQMEKIEGMNAQLRDELRIARKTASELRSTHDPSKTGSWDISKGELLRGEENKEFVRAKLEKILGSGAALPVNYETMAHLVAVIHQVFDELEERTASFAMCEKDAEALKRKVSLLKHQLGILYAEQVAQKKSWETERAQFLDEAENAELEIQSLKAQLTEYNEHFAVIACSEEEIKTFLSDSARKTAAARATEVIQARRLANVEKSYARALEEKESVVSEAMEYENRAQTRLDYLERFKVKAVFKLKTMQKAMDSCVPRASLVEAQKEMRKVAAELQRTLRRKTDLLSELKNATSLEVEVRHLQNENERLTAELEDARSRLAVADLKVGRRVGDEGGGSQLRTTSGGDPTYEVELLTRRLAVAELREKNERERSQHSSKMYRTLQSHCDDLESRNSDLERALDELGGRVSEQERIEAELREELVTAVRRVDYDELSQRLKKAEADVITAEDECEKLKQIATIAERELVTREKVRDESKLENESLRKTVRELQSTTDARAKIAELMEEILKKEKKLRTETEHARALQMRLAESECRKMTLEAKLDEVEDRELKIRDYYQAKISRCEDVLRRIQFVFAGSLPLRAQVHLSDMITKVQEEKVKLVVSVKEAQEKQRLVSEELQKCMVLQEQLPAKADTKRAMAAENYVQVRTLAWKVERLDAELRKMRELKDEAERCVDELQKELIEAHRITSAHWSLSSILGKDSTSVEGIIEINPRLYSDTTDKQVSPSPSEKEEASRHSPQAVTRIVLRSASAQTDPFWSEDARDRRADEPTTHPRRHSSSSSSDSGDAELTKSRLFELELKLELVEKENEGLRQLVERQQADSADRERAVAELRLKALSAASASSRAAATATSALEKELLNAALASATASGGVEASAGSQALIRVAQNTIVSLQKRVAQKDEMIDRLGRLLRETRDEGREMARLHTLELEKVHRTIHKLQERAVERLKSALAGNKENDRPLTVTLDEKEFRELENKVFEQSRNIDNLKEQLDAAKRELNHWKQMADSRGKEADVVQMRLTRTHQVELKTLKEEINRLQRELQNAVEERLALEAALEAMETAAALNRSRGSDSPGFGGGGGRTGSPLRRQGSAGQAEGRRRPSAGRAAPGGRQDPSDEAVASTPLRTLVARLRAQLTEKEKQQAALAGALAELKAEVTKRHGNGRADSVQATKLAETDEIWQEEVSALRRKLKDAKDALRKKSDSEASARQELEDVRETLAAKTKALLQVSEARNALQKKLIQLQSRRTAFDAKPTSKDRDALRSSKEVELQLEVDRLHKSLKESEDLLKITRVERDKAAKHAEELAKWSEKKKWEKKLVHMQSQLKEKDGRLDALEKADRGMRDLLKRMERRLAVALRRRADESGLEIDPPRPASGDPLGEGGAASPLQPAAAADEELEQLRAEVRDMRQQCEQLSKALAGESSAASDVGRQAEERLAKLKSDLARAREDNLQTKLALQEARLEIVRLSEEKKMLELDAELRKTASSSRGPGRRFSAAAEVKSGAGPTRDGGPRRSSGAAGKSSGGGAKGAETSRAAAEASADGRTVLEAGLAGGESGTAVELEAGRKRIGDLERTVGALRRIIETLERERSLQQSDPRLQLGGSSGSPAPSGEVSLRGDKEVVRNALKKLIAERDALMLELRAKNAEIENLAKELQDARLQRRVALEEMENAKRKLDRLVSGGASSGARAEYLEIRIRALEEELAEKKTLLMRVKVLLKDAASREKELIAHQDALRLRVAELESRGQ